VVMCVVCGVYCGVRVSCVVWCVVCGGSGGAERWPDGGGITVQSLQINCAHEYLRLYLACLRSIPE
jgi:hypothetical protein